MEKNKNNTLLLLGMLAISFSSKAMEGVRSFEVGQQGRPAVAPQPGTTTGSWWQRNNPFRTKPKTVTSDAQLATMIVTSEMLAQVIKQDAISLVRNTNKNTGDVAVKAREINDLLTQKIEQKNLSEKQEDSFRIKFNTYLDGSVSEGKAQSVAQYGGEMDRLIATVKQDPGTTIGDDSTVAINEIPLTEQDKIAIEKAGKGGFFSFLHPKLKIQVAHEVVVRKFVLIKDFSPAEKQVFNEVLAQRPDGEETQVQYVARMKALASAERMVMEKLKEFMERHLGSNRSNSVVEVLTKQSIEAKILAKLSDASGDTALVRQELKKVLTVLFPTERVTTQKPSKILKAILDQEIYRNKAKNDKLFQDVSRIDAKKFNDFAAQDASVLSQLGIGKDNSYEAVKAREINTLVAQKIKKAGLTKEQVSLFMKSFNDLLDSSVRKPAYWSADVSVYATDEIDSLISKIKGKAEVLKPTGVEEPAVRVFEELDGETSTDKSEDSSEA